MELNEAQRYLSLYLRKEGDPKREVKEESFDYRK
jgi:hypothetical protein